MRCILVIGRNVDSHALTKRSACVIPFLLDSRESLLIWYINIYHPVFKRIDLVTVLSMKNVIKIICGFY